MLGDYWEESLYFHFPLAYLPRLEDPKLLDQLRRCHIVICVGQGPWERCADYDCIGDALALKAVLEAKKIPAWVDLWGNDVNHDWVWWRRQMPYFLERVL